MPGDESALNMEAIVGLWDGHDAGVALIIDGRTVFAANEERFTRRKLEVGFPTHSLAAALYLVPPGAEIYYAVSTSDPAKCLTRALPSLKESYYRLRRRQDLPGPMHHWKRRFKYRFTQLAPNSFSRAFTQNYFSRKLNAPKNRVTLIDHHTAHAAGAAYGTAWHGTAAILTLDGIGDGLSGSFSHFENGKLHRIAAIPGRHSLGLFFEHVTTQMGMRELEDEGKVMALATLASPVADSENPFLSWFTLDATASGGPRLTCSVPPGQMAAAVARIAWSWPREQVCQMAQRTLEVLVPAIADRLVKHLGTGNLGFAGGVASNIKVNRLIRTLPSVSRLFVFPHMGDGGLALGAAWALSAFRGTTPEPPAHLYLGSAPSPQSIATAAESAARRSNITLTRPTEIVKETARLIAEGRVVMWFQGAMELGPRSLGHRSIVARPDSLEVKDDLNLRLKRRVWFQPFCPSILASEAPRLLSDFRPTQENPFMTSGFMVRRECLRKLAGVVGPDGSCRPQMVADHQPSPYRDLLVEIRQLTGTGAILNTSFNLHGEPVVNTPEEAIDTWMRSEVDHLVLDTYLLEKRRAKT